MFSQRRFDRVKRSQLVNHMRQYFVWESGFAAIPQLFRYKSVLIVFLAISNISLSTVPFINVFLGYRLVDLLTLDSKTSRRDKNGGIVRLPITSKISIIALEKAAFVIKAKPRAKPG